MPVGKSKNDSPDEKQHAAEEKHEKVAEPVHEGRF